MATVKGSKQYRMLVVPHRPLYKAVIITAYVAMLPLIGWQAYQLGQQEDLTLNDDLVAERDKAQHRLLEAQEMIAEMRRDIDGLKIHGEIDDKTGRAVRLTIKSLQKRIDELNEEIGFYKGVMTPGMENEGLQIQRLDLKSNTPGKVKYSLVLTQVANRHRYVQGGVEISLLGQDNGREKEFALSELDQEKRNLMKFRFKYFQNITGEFVLPEGFEPREVLIVAKPSGSKTRPTEKSFDWSISGG